MSVMKIVGRLQVCLTESQDDEDHDPQSRVHVSPVLDKDTYRRDLGRYRQEVAIDKVVPNSKAHSRIDQKLRMAHERTCNR